MSAVMDRLVEEEDLIALPRMIEEADLPSKFTGAARKKLEKIFDRLQRHCSSPLFWANDYQHVRAFVLALLRLSNHLEKAR